MKTVLYIDDEPAIIDIAKQVFVNTTANLLVAKNIKDAHAILSTSRIDVIILDLMLDGECGLDLLDQVKKGCLKNTKIIIVSGWIDRFAERIKKYSHLNLDFLHKPYSAHELLKKINDH